MTEPAGDLDVRTELHATTLGFRWRSVAIRYYN